MRHEVITGDCLEVMPTLAAESIDAVVCDPPYGLSAARNSGKSSKGGFMGKAWDHGVPGEPFWREALRVAKPGAHLLAFGGTRTFHRLACAIEDAGWEIRDTVMWVYGSGFPKSLDISKAIDKAAGAERERYNRPAFGGTFSDDNGTTYGTALCNTPATDAARQWSGWGTSLKPSWEPIIVARKPLAGTVAANALRHGTGGLNIDGCRVGMGDEYDPTKMQRQQHSNGSVQFGSSGLIGREIPTFKPGGRWPANLIHDGSDEVVGLFPGNVKGAVSNGKKAGTGYEGGFKGMEQADSYNDSGSAARFFYCAKASKADRDEGVAGVAGVGALRDGGRKSEPRMNHHPTVKPTDLMRYLCRLVTPPDGLILDPFAGSGSTGKAAMLEGFRFIGIEREAEYAEIARARIAAAAEFAGLYAGAAP